MTTRPPTNRDHEIAFKTVLTMMLFITAIWTVWVIDEQMNEAADAVRELRVP